MTKLIVSGFFVTCAVLLAGCTAKTDSKDDPPPVNPGPVTQDSPKPNATPDVRKVTILIDGMVDRLNLV